MDIGIVVDDGLGGGVLPMAVTTFGSAGGLLAVTIGISLAIGVLRKFVRFK